ncbi:MAG: sulfatase-like hydrolase/transferase [Bacteroidales bacterium]|nr:sulfatase-like hydrolase/transferase [Bacteroidales bacterium]
MIKLMKENEIAFWKLMIIRLVSMLFLLSLSRTLLFFFNINSFSDIDFTEFLRLFYVGLRFDINTLIIFNIPLIVFYGLPFRFKYSRRYKQITDVIFEISNSIAIALNLIDVIYFRYLDKRMCSELFTFFGGTDENQLGLMFSFLADFWYMFLIFSIFLFIVVIITRKTRLKEIISEPNSGWYVKQTISFILILFFTVIGMRGGFQLKPISLLTAANYTTKYVPLVINTPFSIIYGSVTDGIDKVTFFDDSIIDSLYCPIQKDLNYNRFVKGSANNHNVVLIILEGIGQEMMGFYNPKYERSLTPFLDSLLSESLTFKGMANGRRSIEALPSILSGLPSLMATDYPTSRYSINRLDGFGSILKNYGYKTMFFHGGNNGSMSFNTTSKSSGFDEYFGRNEYNNDKDYDGTWGIYDLPFLQFTADKLSECQKPFAAVIYTLSSHNPYSLPQNYNLPDTTIKTDFEKTVRYTDDALASFFKKISKENWFENTIFVITSDHSNPLHYFNEYKNSYSSYRIPVAFYAPEVFENKRVDEIVQQVDLNASILSALCINEPIFTFGRNIFDGKQNQYFISFLNNIYQYSDGNYLLQSDGKRTIAVYDINKDNRLKNNILGEDINIQSRLEQDFKLRLQQYNNRMINNKLYFTK